MSEIKYSMLNDDHRIDAEYFGKNILDTLEKLSDFGTLKIGDIANVTDGIHASIDYDENSPINLISATRRKKMYLISQEVHLFLKKRINKIQEQH